MAKEFGYREIGSVMKKKINTLPRDATVMEAAKLMAKKTISCVIITEKKKPVGIITERDMIKRVITQKLDPDRTTVEKIMSKEVITVPPECALVPTGELMKRKGIRRFVVVDSNENLIGLITQTDILEGILKLVKHLDWKLVTMKISVKEYLNKLRELKIV